jgi:magnesium transporter
LHVLLWTPEDCGLDVGGVELIARWRALPSANLWIDLDPGDGADQARWLTEFGADPIIVEQALAPRFPPKAEGFGSCVFLLLRALNADARSIEFQTIQIALFVGARFLVTRHSMASPSVESARRHLSESPDARRQSPATLALRITQTVVSRYTPIVLSLEERLGEIEDEMFDRPTDTLLNELLTYKRQLKNVRRIASYHTAICDTLARERHTLFASSARDIMELREQFERLVSLANLYNDLANDLMNAYLSLASHRLNNIMKVLTVITCIFVPLSFIAGVYGMNFEVMPELHSRYGYFVVLGIMATVATGLLLMFRVRRWL